MLGWKDWALMRALLWPGRFLDDNAWLWARNNGYLAMDGSLTESGRKILAIWIRTDIDPEWAKMLS